MREPYCPIGLKCSQMGGIKGKYYCRNYFQCHDRTLSWEIPYRTQDGALIVCRYGWRYDWDDEAHKPVKRFCPLPSGSYQRTSEGDHNTEMNERLRKAWLNAGWAAAIPIDEKPCELEDLDLSVEKPCESVDAQDK